MWDLSALELRIWWLLRKEPRVSRGDLWRVVSTTFLQLVRGDRGAQPRREINVRGAARKT